MIDASHSTRVSVFADYFQFHLEDGQVIAGIPTDWTDVDIADRMKQAPSVVVICPVRNMSVPVELQVLGSEPPLTPSDWDHIAETSLEISTGILRLTECSSNTEVVQVAVDPGHYRVRACFGKLDELSENGLEGNDHYLVQLWKGSRSPVKVLKRWAPAAQEGL
jgi:hypothetical protein